MDENRSVALLQQEDTTAMDTGQTAAGRIYQDLTLSEAESYIEGNLITAARVYVANGYFLKRIRDDRLYEEAGYRNFDEYVQEKYRKKKDWASRCIKVNAQLSVGGDSPNLDVRYQEYSTYQLVELAYMNEEQREQATPDQTVKELREIRRPKEIPYFEMDGQLDFETNFPEILPEQVPEQLPAAPQVFTMDIGDLIGQEETVATSQLEDAADTQQNAPECCENAAEPLSAYGTPKKVYPPDSLIATEGCEGGHDCFSCAMECEIRGEERYCMEAPLGNPFPCEHIALGLKTLQEEIGDKCQFINHDLADHCAGSGEADPCCKNCAEPCEYICDRSMRQLDEQQKEARTELQEENDPEPTLDNLEPVRAVLRKESTELESWLKAFEGEPAGQIPAVVEQKKIIVAALASMLSDLEDDELKKQVSSQAELPIMKNTDQRKEFLETFREWPVWFRVPEASEVYYRYDLPDETALVICEYKYYAGWMEKYGYGDGSPDKTDTQEYILTPSYHYLHDCRSSRTLMIEKLKEIQKKG